MGQFDSNKFTISGTVDSWFAILAATPDDVNVVQYVVGGPPHAAWLIAQGEHPKVIQQRLGHASISITMNTYGHLMDGMDERAAEKLDEISRGVDTWSLPVAHLAWSSECSILPVLCGS